MKETVRETVETYFRFINEERFEEFFELFHCDVEFTAPFNFRARGLEHVKPFYLRVPVNYPEHIGTPEEILVSGNRAAVLIGFKGRTKEGIAVEFQATDWFRIENGKIKSLSIFLDSHQLAKVVSGKKKV